MRRTIILVLSAAVLALGCQSTPDKMDKMSDDSKAMAEEEFTVTIEVLSGSVIPIDPVA